MSRYAEELQPNEAAQRTLAIASHEIRGSLAAIVAHAELIVDGELSADRQEEVTRLIARNGRSLLALLDDVLFASRLDAGAEAPQCVSCSVHELLDDLVELLGSQASSRGLYLELELDRLMPAAVLTDPMHLRRILMNLASNAIKFTEQGGVRIRTEYDQERTLTVTVEDTGVGMEAEEFDRIFQPFAQARHRDRSKAGCGLGLAIARELADLLGGTLTMTSERGIGSCFTLTVPIELVEVCAGPQRLDGLRVACVDDCPDSRMLMAHHLERVGAETTMLADGRSLVDLVSSSAGQVPLDAILLDHEMPQMSGLEAAAALRARGCDVPIVMLSAHPPHEIEARAHTHGCDACLSKPIDPDRLASTLQRVCAHTPARRSG